MVITQYFPPSDEDNSKQNNRGVESESSSSSSTTKELNSFDENRLDPSTSKKGVGPTNLRTEALIYRWMNLINFLIVQRSKFSLNEFLLRGFFLSLSFGVGLISKDLLHQSGIDNFSKFTQPLVTTTAMLEPRPYVPFSFKNKAQKKLSPIKNVNDNNHNNENKPLLDMDLDEKQQFFQSFNKLIIDYTNTIEPVSRFKIQLKTFVGFQITSNKLTTDKITTSLANQFDTLSNSNTDETETSSMNSTITSIPFITRLVRNMLTDFPSLRKNYQVRPVFLLGISFDYRAK